MKTKIEKKTLAGLVALLAVCCALGVALMSTRAEAVGDPPKGTGLEFVIVHGAWGGGWAFRKVEKLLTADGNSVHRVTLTGQGERVHLASRDITVETHVQDVVNTILYEDLHHVVLVGHSYGGMVITGVADEIPDRIARLVYVDAVFPRSGESFETATSGKLPADMNAEGFIVPDWLEDKGTPPHDVPQPGRTFTDPLVLKNEAAVRAIPTTYLLTVDPGKEMKSDFYYDQYQRAEALGMALMTMEANHNPQNTKPAEFAKELEKAAVAPPKPQPGK